MFVLKQAGSYEWTVEVKFPVSGDKYNKETFKTEFKRLSEDRLKEILLQVEKGEMGDKDLVKEVVLGWKEVNDDKGNPIEFSEAALEALLKIHPVAFAISRAFMDSLAGAKRKN